MGVALKVAIVFAAFSDAAYSDPSLAPRVGRIIVEGNRVTDQRVIFKHMGLYPGQPLRLSQLRRAQQKLVRLGIFDTVEVTALKSDSRYKDIRVRVKETVTGQVFMAPVLTRIPVSTTPTNSERQALVDPGWFSAPVGASEGSQGRKPLGRVAKFIKPR